MEGEHGQSMPDSLRGVLVGMRTSHLFVSSCDLRKLRGGGVDQTWLISGFGRVKIPNIREELEQQASNLWISKAWAD